MSLKFYLLMPALLLALTGCVRQTEEQKIADAAALIRAGKAECVLLPADGSAAIIESGHGVSPLLEMYGKHREKMAGAIVVDKVIGRAAAAIVICGRARKVHGEVMSEDAVDFLTKRQVAVSYRLLVPRILNRKRDNLCPLEKSVEGINDPAAALAALQRKVASFRSRNQIRKQDHAGNLH